MLPYLCNEIWQLVFSNLEDTIDLDDGSDQGLYPFRKDTHIPTLTSLCLVSHRFYRLARRNLYRTISSVNVSRQQNKMKMGLLARTLLSNSELRSEIRAIDLSHSRDWQTSLVDSEFWPPCIERVEIPSRLRDLLKEDIDRHSTTEIETCLLLALMPNLRMVALTDHQTKSKALTWILGGELKNPQPGISDRPELVANYLGQLEEVHWSPIPFKLGDWSNFSMEPLLLLPNIKKLFLSPFEPSFIINKSMAQDFQSGLQSLRIDAGMIRPAFLQYNLSRCKALQNLDLDLTDCYDIEDTDLAVNLGEFGSVLRNFGQDLVSLKLRFYEDEEYAQREIGSLKGLERLRHLSVPKFVLLGAGEGTIPLTEALPGSLETFEMEFVDEYWPKHSDTKAQESAADDDEVIRLFNNNRFPNLKEVVYGCYMNDQDGRLTNFTKVKGWSVKNTAELRCLTTTKPRYRRLELIRGD
jgi:hypothetical protein